MVNGIKTIEDGDIVWRHPKTKKTHHLDGPAFIGEHYRAYCINGNWHNINGPARIWKNGNKQYWVNKQYWIDDKCYGYNNQKHQWLLISLKRKLIEKKKY